MKIGIPKEIKPLERRVSMTPAGVAELTKRQHQVFVEANAGIGSGFSDEEFQNAGAAILESPDEVFEIADLIVKVKEPQAVECARLREGQTLFTYLHLAADAAQTDALLKSGCMAIAYETVTDPNGNLPLLQPMSEIAGRMSVQVGAACLEQKSGGRGVLLSGAPGVPPADIVILGGGTAGLSALLIALGHRARVTLFERSLDRLRQLDMLYGDKVSLCYSTDEAISESLTRADLVIGSVLVPGATAPKLVRREHLSTMRPGSAIVDIAIDQGGCVETARPTSHQEPTYIVDNVVHYCVTNMPGAVPRTSTIALTNATFNHVLCLAELGIQSATSQDPHLAAGINIDRGRLVNDAVRHSLGLAA